MRTAPLPSLPANLARLTPAERRTTFAAAMTRLAREQPGQAEAITQQTLRQLSHRAPLITRRLVTIPPAAAAAK